jgi:predicted transcriptional regulator
MKNNQKNHQKSEIFVFRYDPASSFESMFEGFWEAVDGKSALVEPHIIRSNSIEALTSNLTKNRLQLFAAIVEKKPANLTELARLLKKDYALVRREARILEGMGLIKLEKVSKEAPNNQGSQIRFKEIKPIALYQRIVFDFPIPTGVEEVKKRAVYPTLA